MLGASCASPNAVLFGRSYVAPVRVAGGPDGIAQLPPLIEQNVRVEAVELL